MRGRVRRRGADDLRPRARPHGRHARQARSDPRATRPRPTSTLLRRGRRRRGLRDHRPDARARARRPPLLRAARRDRHGRVDPADRRLDPVQEARRRARRAGDGRQGRARARSCRRASRARELARAIVAVARGNGLRVRGAADRHGPGARPHRGQRGRGARGDRRAHPPARRGAAARRGHAGARAPRCCGSAACSPTTRRRAPPRARRSARAPPPSASRACARRWAALRTCSTTPTATCRARRTSLEVVPGRAGRVRAVAVRDVGVAVLELGGGRPREDAAIDHAVGLVDVAGLGEEVGPGGRPLAVVHARDADAAERAAGGCARRSRWATPGADAAAGGGGGVSVPLAELHVHLEGTAPPDAGPPPRPRATASPSRPARSTATATCGRDFLDFLRTYDRARDGRPHRARTTATSRSSTSHACAAEGAIYVELTASPDHAAEAGLPYARHGRRHRRRGSTTRAPRRGDREPRDRHRRAQLRHRARRGDRAAPPPRSRTRTSPGFGLAGDEAGFPPAPVRPRLRDRRRRRPRADLPRGRVGRARSPCAGRWRCRSRSTRLGPRRAGDRGPRPGARAGRARAPCSRSARRPTSCSAPTRRYAEHPFPRLRDAGVRVTLGSDDPPYWEATIGGEYAVARAEWGLDDAELLESPARRSRPRSSPTRSERSLLART